MGIFSFFPWFKNNFRGAINTLSENQDFETLNIDIDNLLIDMNGLFHTSTQKIYEYGSNKPKDRLINKRIPPIQSDKLDIKVFEDICNNIEKLFNLVKPKKRLIMAVDGPAPYAKQLQMRRRRFRSAMEREDDSPNFDQNCISPGTKFMDNLTKYIDWFIRKKISEDPNWKKIEVIFSNEKIAGEGESKLVSYIRYNGIKDESYIIHGLDADLIMLSLGLHIPKMFVLRDDLYDYKNKYFVINIGNTSLQLGEMMRWDREKYNTENAIDDFIFLCFLIGNDFLPHVPSLEILEGGIDLIIDVYKNVCGLLKEHLIRSRDHDMSFNKEVLKTFLIEISKYEKDILEKKLSRKGVYFPDEVLEKCAIFDKDSVLSLDIEQYRKDYCEFSFGKGTRKLKKIAHDYFYGLQWIISYYRKGCPNWVWYFPHHYAPPASILVDHIKSYMEPKFIRTLPLTPFQQLLAVLPPKSNKLLPFPLNTLLIDDDSPMKEYCPDKFEIDLSGKKHEYQGLVILPIINTELIIESYFSKNELIDKREIKRNIFGKTYVYKYSDEISTEYKNYYGNFISKVKIHSIFLK